MSLHRVLVLAAAATLAAVITPEIVEAFEEIVDDCEGVMTILRALFRDHTMVCGAVHVGWRGEEDGSVDVIVWYLNRVRPLRGEAPWSVAELSFSGVEHVGYSTEGVCLVTTPDSREETAPSEPWLEVEPFAATPQGPDVLYCGRDTELLSVVGGRDFHGSHPPKDRSRLVHFRVPVVHEGELDVLGQSVLVREVWCDAPPQSVEELARGVQRWSATFPD